MMRPEIAELRKQLVEPKAKEAFDVRFAETVSDPRSKAAAATMSEPAVKNR